MIMSKLQKLRNAANEASEKASQKITKLDTTQFQKLILNLKENGVDSATIMQLEATINDATKRNKIITELVEKGGSISKNIIKILGNFV
jgi:thiamine biosynthesis protein ThiC